MAIPALAQARDNDSTVKLSKAIGTGLGVLGFGLAAGLAGIGQGLVGSTGGGRRGSQSGRGGNRSDDDDHRARAYRIARVLCIADRFR